MQSARHLEFDRRRSTLASWFVGVAVAWSVSACGGSLADDGSNDDGAGDDGSYDGSTDGSSPGSGGGSSECRSFDDEESAGFFEIEIVNSTDATLYLGQEEVNCTQSPFFRVVNESGDELVTSGSDCFASCAEVRDGRTLLCPGICRYPAARRLDAGESTRVLWDARSLERRTLPSSCASSGGEATSCQQWRAHEDEKFTFSVRAFGALDCDDTICGDDCAAADGGGCDIQGALVGGASVTADAVSPSGPDAIVSVVFEALD